MKNSEEILIFSIFHALYKYIIYIGLVLLCATGNLHTSWTIWQLLIYVFNYEHVDVNILTAWFIGVAGGSMFGALLNSCWSKICIYVSMNKNVCVFTFDDRKLFSVFFFTFITSIR